MYTSFYLFLIFMVKKCDFLQVVKIPCPKSRFLVNLRSFFSRYDSFPERGWLFSVNKFKEENFDGKMSSLPGLKKVFQFPAKVQILAIFDYLCPPSKSIFSTYGKKFKNSLEHLLGEFARNIVWFFGLSISSGLWEGWPFCKSTFSKTRDFS